MVPEHLNFLPTHEWCAIEKKGVRIGVTEYALTSLGTIIYICLPETGADILVEIPFGEIEGTDATKNLMSPFDGEIVEINSLVVHDPELLICDPYGEGWLVRLKIKGDATSDRLLSAAAYEQATRRHRR